jgi:gluconolactonase
MPLAERWQGKRLNRPNAVVCRSDGSVYFTDPGMRVPPEERELESSPVFHVAPDGTLSIATAECEYPNGLAFSPDERTLYVANTRTRMFIHAFDAQPDGSLTNHRAFARMSSPEEGVPDGMKVDIEGGVFCTGPGGTWVFDPSGNHLGTMRSPEIPANCAFGGPGYRTLFLTARRSLYAVRVQLPGIKVL